MTRSAQLKCLVALVLTASAARAGDETPARLSAQDAIVRAGKPAKLRARLEGKGLVTYSGVEGESVDFWLVAEPLPGGKPGGQTLEKARFLGSGRTDASGWGELEWTPEATGSYEVEVRVRHGSSYVAIPAPLELLVATHERPIAAVIIEHTLTDNSATNFMRKDSKDVAPIDGAADALAKLAEGHEVVYVTGIEDTWLTKTKEWLRLKNFPHGPVFFWDISTQSLSGEKYKTERVNKLRADFPNLTVGIGGRGEDTSAFYANAVTPYLVASTETDSGFAVVLKTWDKLEGAVARQHEIETQLAELASKDLAKQEQSSKALAKLETPALAYVYRFIRSSDISVGSAARLVVGRVRARDAFAASLDMKTSDSTALASLLAAWRSGDATIAARLYRDGASGLQKSGPPLERFRSVEVVNRSEPEPGRVVYRLRFLPEKDGADAPERDFVFIRGDDGSWAVDSGDL
jgi:hypothetical protein